MLIVAGLSLKNLHPKVWDVESPYHLPNLKAVMISYADFYAMPARMKEAKRLGLHKYLGVPKKVKIYLDNGAFAFHRRGGMADQEEYEDFVGKARPDWRPVSYDAIPIPTMSAEQQRKCFDCTMAANRAFEHDGYVPVIHISNLLDDYIKALQENDKLAAKTKLALGGIVPNLLRTPKAMAYSDVMDSLCRVRATFRKKKLHVFGIGGTATLHLAALLGIDSVDSSGWRNRAARGIVQMPGSGDRMLADLGTWRGRKPSKDEWDKLRKCPCPACKRYGLKGLKASGMAGFSNRATHNLWVLLDEARWIDKHMKSGKYKANYQRRLDNTVYMPLIKEMLRRTKSC
jgi:hypothetical protein